MSDRQCPSCGGICRKSGCERANLDNDGCDALVDNAEDIINAQIQAYGQQCAAHARELALEEAKEAIESANARRVLYVPDCIDVIEALKGK